jgi:hypothetical protein
MNGATLEIRALCGYRGESTKPHLPYPEGVCHA